MPSTKGLACQRVGYGHLSRTLIGIAEVSSQRHRRNGVEDSQARPGDEGGEFPVSKVRIKPQKLSIMGSHMRRHHCDRVSVVRSHHRTDDMPSPKRTAERKGLEAAAPVEAKANGLLQESCEQLDATCTKSLRIKFSDSRNIGVIQTMQFGSFGKARHLIGSPRLGLTLEDRSLKAEAE